jgi:hypothetical protein
VTYCATVDLLLLGKCRHRGLDRSERNKAETAAAPIAVGDDHRVFDETVALKVRAQVFAGGGVRQLTHVQTRRGLGALVGMAARHEWRRNEGSDSGATLAPALESAASRLRRDPFSPFTVSLSSQFLLLSQQAFDQLKTLASLDLRAYLAIFREIRFSIILK